MWIHIFLSKFIGKDLVYVVNLLSYYTSYLTYMTYMALFSSYFVQYIKYSPWNERLLPNIRWCHFFRILIGRRWDNIVIVSLIWPRTTYICMYLLIWKMLMRSCSQQYIFWMMFEIKAIYYIEIISDLDVVATFEFFFSNIPFATLESIIRIDNNFNFFKWSRP